jgi:hypothetical protein
VDSRTTKVYNDMHNYNQNFAMNMYITTHGNFISDDTHSIPSTEVPNDSSAQENTSTWDQINKNQINKNGYLNIKGEDTARLHTNHMHKLLEWHIRLGHMLMKRVQKLAMDGAIPKVLATRKIQYAQVVYMER